MPTNVHINLIGGGFKGGYVPTNPHHDVLYRELSIVQLKELRPSPGTLLQEVINFGTNAFVRSLSGAGGDENIHCSCRNRVRC